MPDRPAPTRRRVLLGLWAWRCGRDRLADGSGDVPRQLTSERRRRPRRGGLADPRRVGGGPPRPLPAGPAPPHARAGRRERRARPHPAHVVRRARQRYAFIAAQPEGQIAKVEDLVRDMALEAAAIGAVAGLVPIGLWLLSARAAGASWWRRRDAPRP